MTFARITLATAFTVIALPAFAGFSLPELPRLDFPEPVKSCAAPNTCNVTK